MSTTATIRVYVGTYGKYNSGSIAGAWLDLSDYADRAEFMEACAELHADESDPEFMFQDWEGAPSGMVSESHVDESVWEWLELDEHDRNVVAAYRAGIDATGSIKDAHERFDGAFDSLTDWAENYADSTGMLESMPENLRHYFDFQSYARDCKLSGDITGVDFEGNVYVFRNC